MVVDMEREAVYRDPALLELTSEQCVERLRAAHIGRIAVVVNEFPIVLPVNFRVVDMPGTPWLAFRTRKGNVLDQASLPAALEIDGLDLVDRRGWSVLAQGTLHHVDPTAADFEARFDPGTWLPERDAWLAVIPFSITGRRIVDAADWTDLAPGDG
jgi:nitroimidazol reductase NimA-like FMN-containing flavoprotein (pyridoxamine 5'-phosphate oxidase superfamily)